MSVGACLTVNGEERQYEAGSFPATVSALVEGLGLDAGMVVAEVNGRIVGRANFSSHALRSGDVVELVRFVGGG